MHRYLTHDLILTPSVVCLPLPLHGLSSFARLQVDHTSLHSKDSPAVTESTHPLLYSFFKLILKLTPPSIVRASLENCFGHKETGTAYKLFFAIPFLLIHTCCFVA